MQIAVFTVPVVDFDEDMNRCNSFLRSVRVLSVQKEFVAQGTHSFWSFVVEYLEHQAPAKPQKKKQVDYKAVLSEDDFRLFSRLRMVRKALAEREGIPIYAVFTNEQLAQIATKRMTTPGELLSLDGVGESKVEKFGSILDTVGGEAPDETSR